MAKKSDEAALIVVALVIYLIISFWWVLLIVVAGIIGWLIMKVTKSKKKKVVRRKNHEDYSTYHQKIIEDKPIDKIEFLELQSEDADIKSATNNGMTDNDNEILIRINTFAVKAMKADDSKNIISLLHYYRGVVALSRPSDSKETVYEYILTELDGKIKSTPPLEASSFVHLRDLILHMKDEPDDNKLMQWYVQYLNHVQAQSTPAEQQAEQQLEKPTSNENEAIVSRLDVFTSRAFREVSYPKAQYLISKLKADNVRWGQLVKGDSIYYYDYILDRINRERYSNVRLEGKKACSDLKDLVQKLKDEPEDDKVIKWMLESWIVPKDCNYDSVYVPEWPHKYIFGVSDLDDANEKQKDFYYRFKNAFLSGAYFNLQGNSNYAFILMFDLAEECKSRDDLVILQNNLSILGERYSKIGNYTQKVLKDTKAKIIALESEISLIELEKSSSSKPKWVKPGEETVVAGVKLSRGYFYLGSYLDVNKENILYNYDGKSRIKVLSPVINPDLEVECVQDSQLETFNSYSSLSNGQRYIYLSFLSGNLPVSMLPQSLLYLYLLGIEYRLFVDRSTSLQEKEEIVKYLVVLYSELKSRHHQDYLVDLIDNGMSILQPQDPKAILGDFKLINLRNYLKISMSEFFLTSQKLSSEKAFEVAEKYFEITKEFPTGERNYEAVKQRFAEHYENALSYYSQYPSYSSSSYSSSGTYMISCRMCSGVYDEFFAPDTDEVYYQVPTSRNENLNLYCIQSATNRLHWDSGKHWDLILANGGKVTAYADMNYASYIDPSEEPSLVELAAKIDSCIGTDGYSMVAVDDFVKWIQYPPRKENGIYKPYAQVIVDALWKMGYGIAPNPKIDGDRLMYGAYCFLYKLVDSLPLSDEVLKGQAVVKMAAQIAMADKITPNDIHLIESGLASIGFEGNTLKYEVAFAKAYSSVKQNFYTSKIIQELSASDIPNIYKLLLRMTFNSGDVSTERVKLLKRYCKYLGQDPDKIHSGIHEAMTTDEFATVEKTTGAVRYSIPKPDEVARKFSIDTSKLERMEKQTKEAQELLSDIFVEEQPAEAKKPSGEVETVRDILSQLLEKEVWEFAEVDEICKSKGLMTGYVLEKINDLSYEKVDDAVVDQDGDQVFVTTDYKEQLI